MKYKYLLIDIWSPWCGGGGDDDAWKIKTCWICTVLCPPLFHTQAVSKITESEFHSTVWLHLLYMGSPTVHVLYFCMLFKIPRLITVY